MCESHNCYENCEKWVRGNSTATGNQTPITFNNLQSSHSANSCLVGCYRHDNEP